MENFKSQIPFFLQEATILLTSWLSQTLPSISSAWWSELVLPALSFQQKERVERYGINSIEQFDLASLLRILDKNWYSFVEQYSWEPQVRNYIKEVQTIRNKWAHIDSCEVLPENAYRDCDTLERLLSSILGDNPLSTKIGFLKKDILSKTYVDDSSIPIATTSSPVPKQATESIVPGSMIVVKSSPGKIGVVVEKKEQAPENRYVVFIDNRKAAYFESQIELLRTNDSHEVKTKKFIDSVLTSALLSHPSTDVLYSLNSARIDFVPYQFRPVLKLIHSDRPRILIADSVGVGKTIEAGLIMRELQVRNSAEKILIICPKPLVTERKWEQEMKRFDEDFISLDGKTLRYCMNECDRDGVWPRRYEKIIVPYSQLNEETLHGDGHNAGLLKLAPPPQWDLVIVDEAHHIRNSNTQAYENVSFFCENAEAVVFLTATPIQMGNQDLFNLLSLIRPDVVIDQASFTHLIEPNPFINAAISAIRSNASEWMDSARESLLYAVQTEWGREVLLNNPNFEKAVRILSKDMLQPEERIELLSTVEEFHTLSSIINRTRRRDIGDFTVRKPITIELEMSQSQRNLYDKLLDFEATSLKLLHGKACVAFLMSTLKRQAASSIYALAPFISDMLNKRMQMLEELACEADIDFEGSVIEEISDNAKDLLREVQQISSEDEKLNALIKIITEKQGLDNNKLMIFSSFRHTLSYLHKKLQALGIRANVIHGGVPDEERVAIRRKFELPRNDANALDVLLFSEVGCEGLDYQFCDTMVNYDLPWNPMRIEQRIGRIDRRGQKSDKILIFNLITNGTIDADIYSRCLMRIGVFEHSVGECDEVLGVIQHDIESIASNYQLSSEEKRIKLQQLADNNIRKVKEQQKIEDAAYEFFGLNIPSRQYANDINKADNYWLRPDSLNALIENYILEMNGNEGQIIAGKGLVQSLKLSAETRGILLGALHEGNFHKTSAYHALEKYLKGEENICRVTFDTKTASENRDIVFITPVHPVTVLGVRHFTLSGPVFTSLRTYSESMETGEYPFIIYEWEYLGMKPGVKLMPICTNDAIQDTFFDLLENAEDAVGGQLPTQEDIDFLDNVQRQLWETTLAEYKSNAKRIYDFKSSSLLASFQARLALVNEQLSKATNEKIRFMRNAQLKNIERDYRIKQLDLDNALKQIDIRMIPLVYGMLRIYGK
jgi:superfamily II DNA or RNA helicase